VSEALLALVVFLVLALVVGLPRILRLPGLPRELAFEEVPDAALTPAQSAHLSRLDALLDRLQYRPVFNIRVTNLPNPNLSRFYTSATDPALLLTSLLRVQTTGGGPAQNADYVEMITRYRDGTELTTLNSGVTTPFAQLPQRIVQRVPGMDPARMKERHDKAAAELLAREPLWLGPGDILERWRESHRRWCEHQEKQGLMRYERASDSYRLAAATGLRGIVNFLNPLGREVTPARLVAAIFFAAVLPSAAILALKAPPPNVADQVAAAVGLPAGVVANAAIAITLFAGGVAIGLVFGQKHFVGTLALGLAPGLILARTSLGAPLIALAIMEWFAIQAHAWRNRRRRLL
jgi:hypothetical protein